MLPPTRRKTAGAAAAFIAAVAACQARPSIPASSASSPPVIGLPIEAVAAPPIVPAEAPPPKRTTSIVDDERPHALDGSLKNPGLATLRAVSAHEAWLEFSVMEGTSYDAIVDLETGCVTETLATTPHDGVTHHLDGKTDSEVIAALGAEDQEVMGRRFSMLARFDHHKTSAVMARQHSDGVMAVSEDHRKLALITGSRVFLSLDGGRTFVRANSGEGGASEGLRFAGGGDRYLTYASYGTRSQHGELAVLDTTAGLPCAPAKVALDDLFPLHVSSAEGLLLFTHMTERCIYGVDPAAPALKQLACIAGPKTTKDHFFYVMPSPSGRFGAEIQGDFQTTRGIVFPLDGKAKPRSLKGGFDLHSVSVGPDDQGRFAWEARLDVLRIDAADGVRDVKLGGSHLGFDLQGRVVVFKQPPLVRAHKPGTMMPPAKGTLAETRCSLVRHVP